MSSYQAATFAGENGGFGDEDGGLDDENGRVEEEYGFAKDSEVVVISTPTSEIITTIPTHESTYPSTSSSKFVEKQWGLADQPGVGRGHGSKILKYSKILKDPGSSDEENVTTGDDEGDEDYVP